MTVPTLSPKVATVGFTLSLLATHATLNILYYILDPAKVIKVMSSTILLKKANKLQIIITL